MTIHTIGDSHSFHGWNNDIIKHWLGPVLCYSFGKDQLNRCDIREFNINHGDSVIFCFGEIDCRAHIFKHITDTISYQNVINSLVTSYIEAIDLNLFTSQLQLKNICIYNIPPTCSWIDTVDHHEFPWLGTKEERKSYALYFNQKLKEKCFEKGYIFFDIYDKCTDENGYLRHDISDDYIHISDTNYLNEFIKDNNL
uniref:SGNH domain-containing protein n=1 Tax=viral metagenome TaxID=1070528 RepID=A0A6C0KN84_9ZZZZ